MGVSALTPHNMCKIKEKYFILYKNYWYTLNLLTSTADPSTFSESLN